MFLSAFADEATVNQVKELGALTYLIKPLDIQQIVPAVEAAFANRSKAASLAVNRDPEVEAPVASAAVSSADPLTQSVALAIGIVMHRHSLGRRQAHDKLRQQATQEGVAIEALCDRLLNAQEVMAGLGSL
jgi:response regulator NasT